MRYHPRSPPDHPSRLFRDLSQNLEAHGRKIETTSLGSHLNRLLSRFIAYMLGPA